MAQSGLHKGTQIGFYKAQLKGVDSGIVDGTLCGITNGTIPSSLPTQDPIALQGSKKPILYGLADYYTQPDGITTTLTDIAKTGYTLTCPAGSNIRPAPTTGIQGNKIYMNFPSTSSYFIPNSTLSLSGYNEISFICVVKLKGVSNRALFHIDDSITPGGIDVTISNTSNQLSSVFYGGQAGLITSSTYNTTQPSGVMSDWMIVVGKYRLALPNGTGSEQEIYINGALSKTLSSSTFNVVTTTFSASKNIIIGNSSTSAGVAGGGIQLGAIAVFPYWLNSQEQFRLENYFRSYYGRKF